MSRHPFLDAEHPIRLAHRGSRVLWPENTAVAFQGAVDLSYRYIETDVRVSRDGVPMVFHDATLERTTNGAGPIAEWYASDLAVLDAGYHHDAPGGFPYRGQGLAIPTLEQVLVDVPGVRFNLDLKTNAAVAPVASLVTRLGREGTVLVGAFSDLRIRRFRSLTGGRVATSAGPATASAMWSASRARRSAGRGVAAFQVPHTVTGRGVVDARFVAACHSIEADVHVWTVNDPGDMRALLALGVDGIVTDRPDLLNDVVGVPR